MGPRRDLVADFVDAARRNGLKVGIYYSLADWSHADYPSPWERDWPLTWQDSSARFVKYCHEQIRELLTRYGPIDYLWFDGAFPQPFDGESINHLAYELQPWILLNERNGSPCDVAISEQHIRPKPGRWEAALTLNRNWGYHATDTTWKTASELAETFLNVRAEGGNLLLNVGPAPDGSIQPPARRTLEVFGAWFASVKEWLPSAKPRTPFSWNNSALLMPGKNGLLMFLLNPLHPEFRLCEFSNRVERIHCPAESRDVRFLQTEEHCILLEDPPPISRTACPWRLSCRFPVRSMF